MFDLSLIFRGRFDDYPERSRLHVQPRYSFVCASDRQILTPFQYLLDIFSEASFALNNFTLIYCVQQPLAVVCIMYSPDHNHWSASVLALQLYFALNSLAWVKFGLKSLSSTTSAKTIKIYRYYSLHLFCFQRKPFWGQNIFVFIIKNDSFSEVFIRTKLFCELVWIPYPHKPSACYSKVSKGKQKYC